MKFCLEKQFVVVMIKELKQSKQREKLYVYFRYREDIIIYEVMSQFLRERVNVIYVGIDRLGKEIYC